MYYAKAPATVAVRPATGPARRSTSEATQSATAVAGRPDSSELQESHRGVVLDYRAKRDPIVVGAGRELWPQPQGSSRKFARLPHPRGIP